jgi:hypothetical protein
MPEEAELHSIRRGCRFGVSLPLLLGLLVYTIVIFSGGMLRGC